ncbi:MAG TPA: hypothetical protein DEW46_02575 [Verrucomicrobia bacterium]|jgi:hypothetical protein|nr:hypothetical protein [Verrucomicrobiota bacterium]
MATTPDPIQPVAVSLILPCLNEEDAIGPLLDQIEEARPALEQAGVAPLEVVVVDDGSTDRTAQEVRQRPFARLVQHPHNRGYGAALDTGMQEASHELLAFFDGDGTCNPLDLPRLAAAQQQHNAGLVIGCRLGPGSRMPPVRKLGNRMFALLLSTLSGRAIKDTASGFRLLTRPMRSQLGPLPTNLSYTPAMTARALFDSDLPVVEVPIQYADRTGESKLHILRDGALFLTAILDTALTCRPSLFFMVPCCLLLLIALILLPLPIAQWLQTGALQDWVFYRLMTVTVAIALCLQLFVFSEIARFILLVAGYVPRRPSNGPKFKIPRLRSGPIALTGFALLLFGILINLPGLIEFARTGQVHLRWYRVVCGAALVLSGFQILGLAVLRRFLELLHVRPRSE